METDNKTQSRITEELKNLVSTIPVSGENILLHPLDRSKTLVNLAALKSAGVSGGLSLPPGPLGMLTIIPDLLIIWKIQRQLVADIAALYGKSVILDRRVMVFCLFRHCGAVIMRDLVMKVGERFLVRRGSIRLIQNILQKVGLRVAQKVVGAGVSRWVPLVGAAAIAGFSYYDTTQVGNAAIELFSGDVEFEDESGLCAAEQANAEITK